VTTKQIDVAIVGAASLIGEAVLSLMVEREFPLGKFYAVDSVEQAGSHIEFKNEPHPINELAEFDFSQAQLALFVGGPQQAADYANLATQSGCIVVDGTGQFSFEDDIPLVVAGVNEEFIDDFRQRDLLATPSSASVLLTSVLKPIDAHAGIESVQITALLAVSEQGKEGQEELGRQTAAMMNFQEAKHEVFPERIAFNLIPQCGALDAHGFTLAEQELIKSTHKVLNNDKISISVTAVQVPVFFCHGEVVHIKTKQPLGADKIGEILDNTSGLTVVKETSASASPTPVSSVTGSDEIQIGRLRENLDSKHDISLWIVGDNIRRGSAINSVQIAEILVKHYL